MGSVVNQALPSLHGDGGETWYYADSIFIFLSFELDVDYLYLCLLR